MRCKSCDTQMSALVLNDNTGEPDDLCSVCRGVAYHAADSPNYEEQVPENYRWPTKRIDPDD